ncbi:MAG: hypothetical protein OEL55_07350 [Desulfobulbaceae bacterium]|nr:hypothetical protein [Desulfobulbaceae bacterium]
MRQNTKQTFIRFAPVLLVATIFFLLFGANVRADEMVSCKYLQSKGKKISLQLDIGSPPPTMLILIQKLPEGISITKSSPQAKKYNYQKREAKWLMKNLTPGTTLFTMELDKEITADQLSGEIRYKSPDSRRMKVIPINP